MGPGRGTPSQARSQRVRRGSWVTSTMTHTATGKLQEDPTEWRVLKPTGSSLPYGPRCCLGFFHRDGNTSGVCVSVVDSLSASLRCSPPLVGGLGPIVFLFLSVSVSRGLYYLSPFSLCLFVYSSYASSLSKSLCLLLLSLATLIIVSRFVHLFSLHPDLQSYSVSLNLCPSFSLFIY